MDRRQFFQSSILGLGALHGLSSISLSSLLGETKYDLAIIKRPDIAGAVKAAVDAIGGIKSFVKPGNIVFLKPNMSFPNPPEWGCTTHPDVIRTMAGLCAEAGAKRVIVADFPMSRAALCFERSGMTALADSCKDFSFIELKDESQFELVDIPKGQEVKQLQIAKLVRKADVFISLPKAKVHSATGISMGLKNMMGLFWNRWTFHRSYDIHNAIVDLATVLRPHLTVLDASWSLLTNGPQGPGKTEQLNTIIAGTDPVAVDAAACGITEWNNRATTPDSIKHLVKAAERGIGTIDISRLKIFKTS